ncbi:SEC-C domain-containing protein [Streptomyces sp. NPDC058092]|uniref:SEC-C domain-containing protein n=1 Tax=Streptomyces sp. NPDC058092 TaxID=3346336 RepID=UPI0036E621CA
MRRHERALEWCQAGLDRTGEDSESPEVAEFRHGLFIDRSFLRGELGLEPDEDDLAAEAEADASLVAFRELLLDKLSDRSGPPGPDAPDDGEAFDGIVLRWIREDFAAVRSRRPEPTALYGDDYDSYAARVQREAGAAHVRMVSATLTAYEAYARRQGRDAAGAATRREFGEWYATAHPDRVLLWPPARNGPCWCDSGRTYKKCCGTPAKN